MDNICVFLQCRLSCESSSLLNWRMTWYTWSRSKESCQCVSSCVSLVCQSWKETCQKRCREKAVHEFISGGLTLGFLQKLHTWQTCFGRLGETDPFDWQFLNDFLNFFGFFFQILFCCGIYGDDSRLLDFLDFWNFFQSY